jgi:hypothetical protein
VSESSCRFDSDPGHTLKTDLGGDLELTRGRRLREGPEGRAPLRILRGTRRIRPRAEHVVHVRVVDPAEHVEALDDRLEEDVAPRRNFRLRRASTVICLGSLSLLRPMLVAGSAGLVRGRSGPGIVPPLPSPLRSAFAMGLKGRPEAKVPIAESWTAPGN